MFYVLDQSKLQIYLLSNVLIAQNFLQIFSFKLSVINMEINFELACLICCIIFQLQNKVNRLKSEIFLF